jgi:UDP-glucose 4-epimerase
MRILLTGDRGFIGATLAIRLRAEGAVVVGYDRVDGRDILDAEAVVRAADACNAVVHLAAELACPGQGAKLVVVNVVGTWNVLAAAEAAGVKRVVFMSSVNVLGVFKGEAAPDYLPLDDEHPARPVSAYGISKLLAEEMCRHFTARTGIGTICLRPPAVWDQATRVSIRSARQANPAFEWIPYWEYGAFIDVDDLCDAALSALACPDPGQATALVCAPDISATVPARDLAKRLLPSVPWRGDAGYDIKPWRALINCDKAARLLGWTPRRGWRELNLAG